MKGSVGSLVRPTDPQLFATTWPPVQCAASKTPYGMLRLGCLILRGIVVLDLICSAGLKPERFREICSCQSARTP